MDRWIYIYICIYVFLVHGLRPALPVELACKDIYVQYIRVYIYIYIYTHMYAYI